MVVCLGYSYIDTKNLENLKLLARTAALCIAYVYMVYSYAEYAYAHHTHIISNNRVPNSHYILMQALEPDGPPRGMIRCSQERLHENFCISFFNYMAYS